MKNIAVIPIDNRPVCYELVKQTAELSGDCRLFLPDRELMGSLLKNADVEGIFSWLEVLEDIDIVVVSLDTIAYGGLIPSRRSTDSEDAVKARINRLKQILEKKNAKVYAFSSIMRISNNNINEEEKEYWNLYGTRIFQYSYNIHKLEKTCSAQAMLAGNCAATRIPDEILTDYLETRKRNFEINKYYIELKKQGFFDTLVFSKDDCSEFGLNVKEAQELSVLSNGIDGIFIKTGADEIPLSLLSRALNYEKRVKVAPLYLCPESADKISKYEDISVKESVESQLELSGGVLSSESDCDMVLVVNNFKNEQGELVMDVFEPLFQGELKLPDKPYFIADILNANGSDNNFVEALLKNKDLKQFYGYSGWNTTGNTLGSALSCALTYFTTPKPNERAFNKLQLTRFLDDWAYQANVRSLIRTASENLTNDAIKQYMQPYEKILSAGGNISYKFPWNRFFEIEIIIDSLLCE